ncbi:MAG TPA: hypothetical protein PK926_02075 [Spirochaetota bacterium]|nr:hypothetical protein [Spirochaetota bacterium]HPI90435.1 hypothetical protein [Spirochaetota bacterium]HPR46561.1 hypothetical protein [Spirochaetota bacterium]
MKVLKGRYGIIARAIMEAIIPRGGAFEAGAADYDLLPEADRFIGCFDGRMRKLFPLMLLYIEYGALFTSGRTFTRMSPEKAGAFLEKMEASPLYFKRAMIMVLKLMTTVPFFDIDEVARQVGYSHGTHCGHGASQGGMP